MRCIAVISTDALAGYVDESNGPEGEPLSLAITVADIKGWGRWGREWLPKIEKLRGGYRAYKHTTLHPALADLMVKHTAFSSFINIRESDYHAWFPKWVQSVIGGPYATGVLFSLMTAAVWSRQHKKRRIFYFVEQGHRNFPHVAFLMSIIMRTEELRTLYAMEGWGAATKEDVPTHCPDTLAHCAAMHFGKESYGTFIDTLYDADKVWRGNITHEAKNDLVPRLTEVAKLFRRAMRADRKQRDAGRRASRKKHKGD